MTVKTAISMDAALDEQTDALAGQMKVSRSRLIGLALGEFIRRHRNGSTLERLNAVYADSGAGEAPQAARLRRASHRRQVEGTW
jgi:hypothetical protein